MNKGSGILIIQTAFIGDVILATSLVESLHQKQPGLPIDILVRKGNEGLFKGHPFLRNVLVFDKQKSKYRNLIHLIKTIRKTQYEAVINAQRFFTTGLITAFSGAKTTIGFAKNPMSFFFTKRIAHEIGVGSFVHEVERNFLLIKEFYGATLSKPKLYPTAPQKEKVAAYTEKPFVAIAPASVWYTKQFPIEKWVELIANLPNDWLVYLIGGPGDKTIADAIMQQSNRTNIKNLTGKLNLLESAALMQSAVRNFVNDSGPLHLCSAMNAPVTAVFCSTIPDFGFGPLSDDSKILEVQSELNCRPCGLHGKTECPEGHFKCALEINTNQPI